MINSIFLKRALSVSLLSLLSLAPGVSFSNENIVQNDTTMYAKISQSSTIRGNAIFADSARYRTPPQLDTYVSLSKWKSSGDPDGYVNGYLNAFVYLTNYENVLPVKGLLLRENAKGSHKEFYRAHIKGANMFGKPKLAHKFNAMNGSIAIGCKTQGTSFEMEGKLSLKNKISDGNFYGILSTKDIDLTDLSPDDEQKFEIVKFMDFSEDSQYTTEKLNLESFSYQAGFLNAYHDFETGSNMKLYAGGGIGLARVKYNIESLNTNIADEKVKTSVNEESFVSVPIVTQAKVGAMLDMEGIQPYIGYTIMYFNESTAKTKFKSKAFEFDLNVRRNVFDVGTNNPAPTTTKLFAGDPGAYEDHFTTMEFSKVLPYSVNTEKKGAEYKLISSHLIHNIEVGFAFPLN